MIHVVVVILHTVVLPPLEHRNGCEALKWLAASSSAWVLAWQSKQMSPLQAAQNQRSRDPASRCGTNSE